MESHRIPGMLPPEGASPTWMPVVQDVLEAFATLEGALLPVLHDIQEQLGYIPEEAMPVIAHHLNLSRAEVHGVVTFYHHFRTAPPGQVLIQVCRAEACQALGSESILKQAQDQLGCVGPDHTSVDRRFTVEPVYCLGLCSVSPAAQVGERPLGRLTLQQLLQAAEEALQATHAQEVC